VKGPAYGAVPLKAFKGRENEVCAVVLEKGRRPQKVCDAVPKKASRDRGLAEFAGVLVNLPKALRASDAVRGKAFRDPDRPAEAGRKDFRGPVEPEGAQEKASNPRNSSGDSRCSINTN